MTSSDPTPVDDGPDAPDAVLMDDASAVALDGLIDEGTPRADSADPAPDEPVAPAAP